MSSVRTVPTASGGLAVQIVTKHGRDIVDVEHIGSTHSQMGVVLLRERAYARLRQRLQDSGQQEFDLGLEQAPGPAAGAQVVGSFSRLLFQSLVRVWERLGFQVVKDQVFRDVVIARVIEPVSKRDTIRVLNELGLDTPSYSGIHRCLNRCQSAGYRERLSLACVALRGVEHLTLVLYDITTLFFYAEKEDEFRKPGLSKERRLEPQILIGLLVDRSGFPLQVHSFEGNRAETLTVVPVLDAFRKQFPGVKVSVACDAGMLSASNLEALEAAGYGFIVGSRIAKTPYDIAEYQAAGGQLDDGQIFDTVQEFGRSGARVKRRVVYQYRVKRARLDLRNIDKQVQKAQRVVAGVSPVKKSRFLTVSGERKTVNEALVASAKSRAGIKGYVTNLEEAPEVIIQAYHELFNVEASFRMAKTDLRARPVFHRVREKIEAHLTVVFAAIAMGRWVQECTGVSVKRFVKLLAPLKDAVIEVDGREYDIPTKIPPEIQTLLSKLA